MGLLFGPSLRERSQLVRTLQGLGPTSIEGLAAALSWSPRRTERLVTSLARRGEGGIWYSPSLREVRFGPPTLEDGAAPRSDVDGSGPVPALEAEPSAPAPAGAIPASSPRPGLPDPLGRRPGLMRCVRCGGPMEQIDQGASLVCPRCGRLTRAPRENPAISGPSDGPAPLPVAGTDRRSQEMLAAYVASRPIPCPRCRTPLRHAGLGSFRCPACGNSVAFPPTVPAQRPPPLPTAAIGPHA